MAEKNLKEMYGRMRRQVNKLSTGRRLSKFIREIRSRVGEGQSLPLEEDEAVGRLLKRLGILGRSGGDIGGVVSAVAEAAGESPLVVGLVLRLYADGVYGVSSDAVCGEVPKCARCSVAEFCNYRRREQARGTAPPGESPVERMRLDGPDVMTSAELLALVLSGGREDARSLELARRILVRTEGLRAIGGLSAGELGGMGLSPTKTLLVGAAISLAKRFASEKREIGRQFRTGRDFFQMYRERLGDMKKEVFLCVLLDQQNRFLKDVMVAEGSLTAAIVHPREVFNPAIRESAAAVAFIHNHPSGDPAPSKEDVELTARLVEAGSIIGIRVLDHVVVGRGEYVSFVDEGLLQQREA